MKKHFFKRIFSTILLLVPIIILSCAKKAEGDKPGELGEDGDKIKVGAWYFGGWSFPPDGNGYTFHISPSLVTKFSDREPLWGWREDEKGIMIDQINYASNSGLS